ncbi:hypothetical protein [Sphingomonas yabuuchiae]|uniref:hypothetical protein n=1 Tax=Sphingomonas yabuuchiae TaxID=172044 RepID=UPI000736272A|nr:hypothetical protein [Sphingomonas yabuuchiae]
MPTTSDIAKSIEGAATRLETIFGNTGWSKSAPMIGTFGYNAPAASVDFITIWARSIADRVKSLTKAELDKGSLSDLLSKSMPLFDTIQFGNVSQDADGVVGGFTTLLAALDARLPPIPSPPPPPPKVDWEDLREEKTLLPKDLARRLRGVASKLSELEPRGAELDRMVAEIIAARAAAEDLPTDIEDLREKRALVQRLADEAAQHLEGAKGSSIAAAEAVTAIEEITAKAEQATAASEKALVGATGVGLAAAFENRKAALSTAGFFWTLGLIGALIAGLIIGWDRVSALKEVLTGTRPASVIWANVVLAVVGVGGPIWFAWLSTKQIGSAFRLAEDYAFKAAMSKAYEGYRKEAIDLDPDLRSRLFDTALTRLEEAPIRLLDTAHHASPLQELLANPALRKQLEAIPGVIDKIIALIPLKGGGAVVAPIGAAAAAAAALKSAGDDQKADNEKAE